MVGSQRIHGSLGWKRKIHLHSGQHHFHRHIFCDGKWTRNNANFDGAFRVKFWPLTAEKFLIKYASRVIGHIKLTTCSRSHTNTHKMLMSTSKHDYIKHPSVHMHMQMAHAYRVWLCVFSHHESPAHRYSLATLHVCFYIVIQPLEITNNAFVQTDDDMRGFWFFISPEKFTFHNRLFVSDV